MPVNPQRPASVSSSGSAADYLSVSAVNQLVNETLEAAFPELRFTGEISDIKRAQSGHVYLTIKDSKSQVSAVMWAGLARSVSFPLAPGLVVMCHAKPNLYPVTGRYQLIVHRIMPAGEGELRRKFLELKAKLEREGLFAPERKRRLPFLPLAIGVVTSQQGAVIHDIMVRVADRMPSTQVYLINVRVQGPGAAEEIGAAIERFNELRASGVLPIELLIVGRGGGSLEDLWAFNEERVVRAIFASRLPVVSAVGHEVDVSLSDFVADVRAPTPTAAAEMVLPHRRDLQATLDDFGRRLSEYTRWFRPLEQQVDELEARLRRAGEQLLQQRRLAVQHAATRVRAIEPSRLIAVFSDKIGHLHHRLQKGGEMAFLRAQDKTMRTTQRLPAAMRALFIQFNHRTAGLSLRLEAASPQKILDRGYAVVEFRGKALLQAAAVGTGDEVAITLAGGKIAATVI